MASPKQPEYEEKRDPDNPGRRVNDYNEPFLFENRRKTDPKGRRRISHRIDVV